MERTWSKRSPTSDQVKVGNRYRVPCILRNGHFVPVYDCPHNDEESGQPQAHYHVDGRFLPEWMETLRIDAEPGEQLYHRVLECHRDVEPHPTGFGVVAKAPMNYENLKCKKCPHKGFYLGDLTPDENGVVQCPLHGTKVNVKSFTFASAL